MKIALVLAHYTSTGGGTERWTHHHAHMLINAGHEVHLVAEYFDGAPHEATCHHVDPSASTMRPHRLKFADAAERLLRKLDVDVIHDMGDGWYCDLFMPHHGVRRAVYNQRTKILTPPHRWMRPAAFHLLPRYVLFKAMENRQYAPDNRTTYLAVSDMVGRHMQHYHHVPAERIRVIHNGVDAELFDPIGSYPHRQELRRVLRYELGVDGRVVFLLVAHDFRLKGLTPLIHAIGSMVERDLPVALIVVGREQTSRYELLAERCRCRQSVRFVGAQPDAIRYYHAADAYVQPTYYDSCSLTVLEALACGLPAITTRFNGAAELMQSGLHGHVIDNPDDIDELAQALTKYLDPQTRRGAGLAARKLAQRNTHKHNFERICNVYEQIAHDRPSRHVKSA